MRFEKKEDLDREKKAIRFFVNMFGGSFKKLDPNDIDFKVFDKDSNLIAYAEVKGRKKMMRDSFPLPVSAYKLAKLSSKRLNPVIIWACEDGIIYAKIHSVEGVVRWGGREPRQGSYNDQELMVFFNDSNEFKKIRYNKK